PISGAQAIRQYEWQIDKPQYWRSLKAVREPRRGKLDVGSYLFGFKNAAQSMDERTLVAALIPPGVIVTDSLTVYSIPSSMLHDERHLLGVLYVLALFNSYVADWLIRMRVSKHIMMNDVRQLPLPRLTESDPRLVPIALRAAMLTCTTPEFD